MQYRQKQNHDTTVRATSFEVGDTVYVRYYIGSRKWRFGVVSARTGPLSYNVQVGQEIVHRHVSQMRSTKVQYRTNDDDETVIQRELQQQFEQIAVRDNNNTSIAQANKGVPAQTSPRSVREHRAPRRFDDEFAGLGSTTRT
jgi:hypothetical protein